MHWHNAMEILMPTENSFPVICGSTMYNLGVNDILIIPPGELHNLKAQVGRRYILLCDNAMFKDNPAVSELFLTFTQPIWINEEYNKSFVSELNGIIIEMSKIFDDSPPFCETLLYAKLIDILLKIAEYKIAADDGKTTGGDKIELIKRYVDKFYMNDITLDCLSQAIGYSKYYLSRLLAENNISFPDTLNMRRIKEAEIMLRNESTPITQIAVNVGFTSIATFNRAFRKAKGCTPTQFRNMYREKNE